MSLPEFILITAEEKNITIPEVARRAAISSMAISKIMRGKTRTPALLTLDKISQALDVPLGSVIEACGFQVGCPSLRRPEPQDV